MKSFVFDAEYFKEAYPHFADFTAPQLEEAFALACLHLDNSEKSPIAYDPPNDYRRRTFFHLLICHICELSLKDSGQIGALSSASQGSVSASFKNPEISKSAAWYSQTQCGLTFWELSAPYRLGGKYYSHKKDHSWG